MKKSRLYLKVVGLAAGVALLFLALILPIAAAVTPVDFNDFRGQGFSPLPLPGQLDSDYWRVTGLSDGNGTFGGTHDTGDFARGLHNGGTGTGGVYAFDLYSAPNITDTILGVQPTTDDFTPGAFTLRLQNTTGSTLDQVYVAYEIWTRNDQPRSNSLNFAYSKDDSVYTSVAALDFTTPLTADPSPFWSPVTRTVTLSGLGLANGAYLYLRWQGDDVGGSGSRDEYGIDDVVVSIGGPTALGVVGLRAESGVAWAALAAGLLAGAVVALRRLAIAARRRS